MDHGTAPGGIDDREGHMCVLEGDHEVGGCGALVGELGGSVVREANTAPGGEDLCLVQGRLADHSDGPRRRNSDRQAECQAMNEACRHRASEPVSRADEEEREAVGHGCVFRSRAGWDSEKRRRSTRLPQS